MDPKLNELEQFLQTVVKNYPQLPKATNIEDKIDNALAYKEILSDYNLKATYKIKELFSGNNLHHSKTQIQKIAAECLYNYYTQPTS